MIDLIRLRSHNQGLTRPMHPRPEKIVARLGAVQAQDYAGAKWALGLRHQGLTDVDVERAFTDGAILRTHVLRPTWHFVCPADIRWMLALTAPRVKALSAPYYRKLELDHRIFSRSQRALERALGGSRQLTRTELSAVLKRAGIAATGMRLAYLMMHAELDQVICSGPRRGLQFTYMLLEERAPRARRLVGDEALAELTLRYFSSHGPATIRDFAWWSGLTTRDAKRGLEILTPALTCETLHERVCWYVASSLTSAPRLRTAWLLPNYDEYVIAYKDRDPVVNRPDAGRSVSVGDVFPHHLVVDGRLAGSWMRTVRKDSVVVGVAPYRRLTASTVQALDAAVERHGRFMNRKAQLTRR